MENVAAATRSNAFPAGLRVLVVDDDPTWLKILEKMLRKCSYEVTTCGLARTALDILRGRKDRFDIVISDVNMPDMDGFKLLEQVGLQMDLPVIMMSVDGETSRVMKGVQHGACDYLLKPIRMKELKNIWQHVFRKKIHEMKEIESFDSNELSHIRNQLETFDEWQMHSGGDLSSAKKKRKDVKKEHNEQCFSDTTSMKKARIVWSVDLHQKFVNAVNQIGFEKVGPKKILDMMNVPGLTRENVASHLQKYRLYLCRLRKQNEGKTLSEIMKSGTGSKDSPGNTTIQSLTTNQISYSPTFDLAARITHIQDITPRVFGRELRNTLAFQVTDMRKVMNTESGNFQKLGYIPKFGVVTSSQDSLASCDYDYSEVCISKHHHKNECHGNVVIHAMKHGEDSTTYETNSQLQQLRENLTDYDHCQLYSALPINMLNCAMEIDNSSSHLKPTCFFETIHARNVPSTHKVDLLSSQADSKVRNEHFGTSSGVEGNRSYNDRFWSSRSQLLTPKAEWDVTPLHDFFVRSIPTIDCLDNIGTASLDTSEYKCNQASSVTNYYGGLYDEVLCNSDYLFDLPEVPTVGHGLFT